MYTALCGFLKVPALGLLAMGHYASALQPSCQPPILTAAQTSPPSLPASHAWLWPLPYCCGGLPETGS